MLAQLPSHQSPESDSQKPRHLVLVPAHAIYKGKGRPPSHDSSWHLKPFQQGEAHCYLEHIRAGVSLAGEDPAALLIFSGGMSFAEAPGRSEAQGYYELAELHDWWGQSGLAERTHCEEYARDSFENLLFSVCRFYQITQRLPERILIAGWAFKRERFLYHAKTITYPESRLIYFSVNDPFALTQVLISETDTLEMFGDDPFGTNFSQNNNTPLLGDKRIARDPFDRRHDYVKTCPPLAPLLTHMSSRGKFRWADAELEAPWLL